MSRDAHNDRRDAQRQRNSGNALLASYLSHVAQAGTDAGFSAVIGSALQDLRRLALERKLVSQQQVGLTLTVEGRTFLDSQPPAQAASRR